LSFYSGNAGAISPVIGGIITIAITVVLAMLVLLLFHMPNLQWHEAEVPAIFKITKITHGTNFESTMVVKNTGPVGYKNENLYATTYRNGIPLPCIIETLNGNKFISTHHFGVQNIAGMSGKTWYADWSISINYKDKTFHPGDEITFEVYDNATSQIISRHTYRA
jgi:flagellin-like protein